MTYMEKAKELPILKKCTAIAVLYCPGQHVKGGPIRGRKGCKLKNTLQPMICIGCWEQEAKSE